MKRLFVLGLSVMMVGILTPSLCHADDQSSGILTFQSTDQSMWSSGSATTLNYDPTLVTIPVNLPNTSFDATVLGTGVKGNVRLSGDVGLSAAVSVNGGTVSATVPVNIGLGFPDAVPLDGTVDITSSALFGTGSLSTASPTAQASLNAFANLTGALSLQGCVSLVGCSSPVGPTINTGGTRTDTLFSVNSATVPPQTLNLGDNVGLTVSSPYVQTTGTSAPVAANSVTISSTGSSPFLGLNADITNLVAGGLGLPPTSASIDLGPAGSVGYNLADLTAGLSLDTTQAFALNATPMVEYNVSETGSNPMTFTSGLLAVGTPFDFTFVDGDTSALITPEYLMSAKLNNNTGGAIAANLGFSALGLTLPLGINLGPYVDASRSYPLGSFSVYDQTFSFLGWNAFSGNSFAITASPTLTPEPRTIVLLCLGLLAIACFLRRRIVLNDVN
jgi:hypothetical protein